MLNANHRHITKGEINLNTGMNVFRSETMDVMEFIARRIQHIPSPYFQKVRFMPKVLSSRDLQ